MQVKQPAQRVRPKARGAYTPRPRRRAYLIGRSEGLMKVSSFSVFAFTALCHAVLADQPRTEPTAFETFATKSSARVLFTEHVGSIDSTDAKLRVTALVVDDVERPTEKMSGVRFELENNTTQDQVYLVDA